MEKQNATEKCYNLIQKLKKEQPVITFLPRDSVTKDKGSVHIWNGTGMFEGKEYKGQGGTKKEAKDEIFQSILKYLEAEVAEGADRAYALSPTLSLPPKGKKGKKGKGSRERGTKRLWEKLSGKDDFVTLDCHSCARRNFIKNKRCSGCNTDLNVREERAPEVFLDMEREKGDLTAAPLSIGLVAVSNLGNVKEKKEIFILPEGSGPSKKSFRDRKVIEKHHMYVEWHKGKKMLMKDTSEGKVVLNAVEPRVAAREVVEFLVRSQQPNIYFHGPDMKSLLPFLEKYQEKSNFYDAVGDTIDTQPFYKWVQVNKSPPSNKFGMAAIVQDWGTVAEKEMYNKGAHSALVDADVLASISTGRRLGKRFEDFHAFGEGVDLNNPIFNAFGERYASTPLDGFSMDGFEFRLG